MRQVETMPNFKLEWLSANSSTLNSIERVFGILKKRVMLKHAKIPL